MKTMQLVNFTEFDIPDWCVYTRRHLDINEEFGRCCDVLGTSKWMIRSKHRQRPIVEMRAAITIHLFDNFKSNTLCSIGALINRDHTTVLYYTNILRDIMEVKTLIERL